MSITLRQTKGTALTYAEADENWDFLDRTKADKITEIATGTGLQGGGDLSENRTLSLTNTGVTAGAYGDSGNIPVLTIDSQGRITSVSTTTISGLVNTPAQGGNAGKFLQTNGSSVLWADAYPDQTDNSGKFLTTDGSNTSWGTVDLTPYATTTDLNTAVTNSNNWDTAYSWGDHAVPNYTPPGTVTFFARNSAPNGWLKCNGATISRTTYSDLFTAIGTTFGVGDGSTTFALPDLRGEFLRCWDDGRGADSGRTFGSFQESTGVSDLLRSVNLYRIQVDNPDSVLRTFAGTNGGDNSNAQTITVYRIRPRNRALLACIKY